MQYLSTVSKMTEWSQFISSQSIQYHSNSSLCPTTNAKEAEVEWFYNDPQELLELTTKTDVLFIIGDWNAKAGTQKIPEVTGTFGLGVQNEVGKMLTEFCQENALVIQNTLFQHHKRWLYTWTSQYVNTKIRLIIFFAAKDGKALYSQQK